MIKKIGYERWANCNFVFLVLSNFILIRKFKGGIKKAVSFFAKHQNRFMPKECLL